MRAQQVTDLNAARKNVTELQKQMVEANNLIDTICVKLGLSGGNDVIVISQIICVVIDSSLHVLGAANLLANGYVTYIFRLVRKRNKFKDKGKRRVRPPRLRFRRSRSTAHRLIETLRV